MSSGHIYGLQELASAHEILSKENDPVRESVTFDQTCEESRPRYSQRRSTRRTFIPDNIPKDLQVYHSQVLNFKSRLLSTRSNIVEALNESIDTALETLDSIQTDLVEKISFIESVASSSDEFRLFQNMYRISGLEGILQKCPRYLMLYDEDALKLIRGLVYIGESAEILDPEMHEYSKLIALRDQRTMHLELQTSYLSKKVEQTELAINRLSTKLKRKNEGIQKLQEEVEFRDRSIKELQEKQADTDTKTDFDTEGSVKSKYSFISRRENSRRLSGKLKLKRTSKLSKKSEYDTCSDHEGLDSPTSSVKSYEYTRSPKNFEILENSSFDEFDTKVPWVLMNPKYITFLKQELKSLYQEQQKYLSIPDIKSQHFQRYADSRYIYYTNKASRSINQVDTILQHSDSIDLSRYITRNFNETSTCILPSGDVLIAGFFNPISSEAYIYRMNQRSCVRIQSLEVGRFYIRLYYYDNYVYALGGRDEKSSCKTAERFNLGKFSWERLTDMKVARNCCACVGIVNKLYIFGGGARSIEEFNTLTCKFRIMKIPLDNYYVNIAKFEDKIYIIGKNSIRVLNSDLETLESRRNLSFSLPYSINNSLLHHGILIFYNHYLNNLVQHNLYENETLIKENAFPSRRTTVPTDSIKQEENRYLYRPRDNTKILYHYDSHFKKLYDIDISASLPRNFSSTSSAALPNGDVFLAGFSNPLSNEAYIYKTSEKRCIKVENMNVPRYFLGLQYYKNCVYALGGSNGVHMLPAIERYDMNTHTWTSAQDLYHARSCCGAVGVEDRLYIFGGGHQGIEELNLKTLKMRLTSVYTKSFDCIGVVRSDEIYIIGDTYIRVYDLELKRKVEYKDLWNQVTYSTNNFVLRKNSCIFYNEELNNLEKVRFEQKERKVIILHN